MSEGFRVNLPVKIADEDSHFHGMRGIVKGHDTDGGYWVQFNEGEGSHYFHSGCVLEDITENILEIVAEKILELPEEIERELEGKKALGMLQSGYYNVYRYDLQGKTWRELVKWLNYHKETSENIIDYKVHYYG